MPDREPTTAAASTERASLFSFVRRCRESLFSFVRRCREWWLTTGSSGMCEEPNVRVPRCAKASRQVSLALRKREVVVIEPTSRLRAVEGENSRLRRTLEAIAEQGDKHNGEFVRLARREGEPESWAARRAYFALHPERQDGRNA